MTKQPFNIILRLALPTWRRTLEGPKAVIGLLSKATLIVYFGFTKETCIATYQEGRYRYRTVCRKGLVGSTSALELLLPSSRNASILHSNTGTSCSGANSGAHAQRMSWSWSSTFFWFTFHYLWKSPLSLDSWASRTLYSRSFSYWSSCHLFTMLGWHRFFRSRLGHWWIVSLACEHSEKLFKLSLLYRQLRERKPIFYGTAISVPGSS